MAIRFSADEVFEMAEQIERNGAAFYRKAAERSEAPQNRELLLRLANMEDDHEDDFISMRANFARREQQEPLFDPDGEAAMYLRALASSEVFDFRADPTELITAETTLREVLTAAIELEKQSIIFYVGMKEMVPQELGRDKIDELIREEMEHINTLSKELSALRP